MDKFREKYALHNKYRRSTARSDVGSTSTDGVSESNSVSNSNGNSNGTGINISTSNHMMKKKLAIGKLCVSSSETISTAASFESGDTNTNTNTEKGGHGKHLSSNPYHPLRSRSAHQPLDNTSGGIHIASITRQGPNHIASITRQGPSRKRIERRNEDALALASTREHNVAAQADLQGGVSGAREVLGQAENMHGSESDFNKRAQPAEKKGALMDHFNDIPENDIPPVKNDSRRTDLIQKEYPSERENGKSKASKSKSSFSIVKKSPSRDKDAIKDKKKIVTPPRLAQTHDVVHLVPTEAQLRWAQFHQKKRAAATQQIIQKLMKTPLHVQMVRGVMDGDGEPFSSSDEESLSKGRSQRLSNNNKKFVLSKGRRALLRVSARRTEERRLYIREHGYAMAPDDEEDSTDDDEGGSSHHQSSAIDETLAFEDIAEALHIGDNSLLREEPAAMAENHMKSKDHPLIGNMKKKKRKNLRKKANGTRRSKGIRNMDLTADEDEERMKRFEEAYTLLCTVKHSDNNVIKASKRWSRASNIQSAVSIDGRVYSDLQRSPTLRYTPPSKRYGPEIAGAKLNGMHLADRGASWMMHLPQQIKARPNRFFGQNSPANLDTADGNAATFSNLSPTRKKLMEIAGRFQNHTPIFSNDSRSAQGESGVNGIASSNGTMQARNPSKVSKKQLFASKIGESVKPIPNAMRNFNLGINVNSIRDKLSQSFRPPESDDQDDSTYYTDGGDSDLIYEEKIQMIAAQVKSSNSVIDTDNQSLISEGADALMQSRMGNLVMSPTILTKRLNQAVAAVQLGQWEQVGYLILANPWLAEMTDVNTDQYLLHKLAFFGAGTITDSEDSYDAAPKKLTADLIKASPAAIHKFDNFGNLPLHCAAEAGNSEMATRLAKIFPSGASVRNNDGQLPLHLAVLACANANVKSPLSLLSRILSLFPSALAIADNDGNLPLHLAAAYLTGDLGAEVIHLLLDEADKQGGNLRFPSSIITLENVDDTMSNVDSIFNDPHDFVEKKSVLAVKNRYGWNSLVTAIQSTSGYQVLDALLTHPDAASIALERHDGQNILQLSIVHDYCNPQSIISILTAFPNLATSPNEYGALPIEDACLRNLDPALILHIALFDLPFDPNNKEIVTREGFGGSWWYLNCECDDNYVHIVVEILEICDDFQQQRALCSLKDKQGNSVMTRATPKCKRELRKTMRFDGRYEFTGVANATSENVRVFEALDFGLDGTNEEGRKVLIEYYRDREEFNRITETIRRARLNALFADIRFFETKTVESSQSKNKLEQCIIIESPFLTLETIVAGMAREDYRNKKDRLDAHLAKIRKILRNFGNSVNFLHKQNIVHGGLSLQCCAKYEDGWKLTELIGAQFIGNSLSTSRVGYAAPPESVTLSVRGRHAYIPESITAAPSLDIWAFGKMMYEVLVGEPLLPCELDVDVRRDQQYLDCLGNWGEADLSNVVEKLEDSDNGILAADLISHCLCRRPELRPNSMEEVLSHQYWKSSISQVRSTTSTSRNYANKWRRFHA